MRATSLMLIAVLLAMFDVGCARHRTSAPPATVESPAPPEPRALPSLPATVRTVKFSDDITVHIDDADGSFVEIRAQACLDEGYLEQIACSPATREHESLIVVSAKPSQIHAAMLMAGFEPGTPGMWLYEGNVVSTKDPAGDKIDVRIRYVDPSGEFIERPVRDWMRRVADADDSLRTDDRKFPKRPWVFAGSRFAPNTPRMGPGEHYVADMTGSIVGLVTFGDEVIGFSVVLSDQVEIQPQEWEVNTEIVPPMGTDVTLVLRRWQE